MARLKARVAIATSEEGASAVEYALLVALIAGLLIAVIAAVGADALNGFNSIEDQYYGDGG